MKLQEQPKSLSPYYRNWPLFPGVPRCGQIAHVFRRSKAPAPNGSSALRRFDLLCSLGRLPPALGQPLQLMVE